MTIKRINPVAKAVSQNRRRTATQVVPPQKGKGSYNRKKDKEKINAESKSEDK